MPVTFSFVVIGVLWSWIYNPIFGLLNNFDAYVFSYEIGATKPSTKIFQTLVDRSGVKAEEIVFADDNDANLAGAKKAGIQAFFYEGFDHFMGKLKELGVEL